MPIRLRFALHGTRNNRIFHLVAINSRNARNAAPAELLGIYDPRLPATIHPDGTRRTPNTYNAPQNPAKTIRWSVDRIRYWLAVGAVPTKSVERLLEAGGILGEDGKRIVPEGVSIHALNTRCTRCGVEGHAVRDCEQPPEKVDKVQVKRPTSAPPLKAKKAAEKKKVEEKKVERKEPTGAFADLLKSSREIIASSTPPSPPTTLTPTKKSKSLLSSITPPTRSPLASYTIDSLSTMSPDEITILFTFWEEWENARLLRIRARREFEETQHELDDNTRMAMQREWDAMGPEPEMLGYNELPDSSDRFEGEEERFAAYHKKDIEREFSKIRDHTTPAEKFVPSTLSSAPVKEKEEEWKKQRAAEFIEEKLSTFQTTGKPDVERADLEALFRDVKSDVDVEREREFVLKQVAEGKI